MGPDLFPRMFARGFDPGVDLRHRNRLRSLELFGQGIGIRLGKITERDDIQTLQLFLHRRTDPLDHGEIVGEALEGLDVVIATKGGVDKPEPGRIVTDGSRDTLLRQIDRALVNLRRRRIDLFQLHRVDPDVPIEDSVAALAEARDDGRIRQIGLSNVTRDQLDRALAIAPIAAVQNRFNMAETDAEDLVDFTAERGIAFIPYGPLGANPMKQGAKLAPKEALAWLLRRSPNIVVIPGTTSIAHLEENWRAWEEVERLDEEAT